MKKKIKVIDNLDGNNKVIEKEITIRDYDHFVAQRKFKATVIKSKKIYTRKIKHKKRYSED